MDLQRKTHGLQLMRDELVVMSPMSFQSAVKPTGFAHSLNTLAPVVQLGKKMHARIYGINVVCTVVHKSVMIKKTFVCLLLFFSYTSIKLHCSFLTYRFASEMTCIVSGGALNYSLTHSHLSRQYRSRHAAHSTELRYC